MAENHENTTNGNSEDEINVNSSVNKKESKNEAIKRRTLELYDSLPQDEEGRKSRLDVRDQVIDLNYTFFGYVASHTFINNSSITYEDKLQSCLMHFCECWWWYKWAERYRTDLSFTVFFKPRLGEMIERELNEVKYSIRRSLCMEAGAQIGKHWGQVKYDDLKNVQLPADKMNALKAMFGTLYTADIEEHEMFIEAPILNMSEFDNPSDNYNSIEEFLLHEMVLRESKLDNNALIELSDIYGIDYMLLKKKLPAAEDLLYRRLKASQDLKDS